MTRVVDHPHPETKRGKSLKFVFISLVMVILNYWITEQYAPSNDSSYFRATRIETGADCYLRVIPVN